MFPSSQYFLIIVQKLKNFLKTQGKNAKNLKFPANPLTLTQACFLYTFWRPSRPNRASYPWVFIQILEFFCPNLKSFWQNSFSFWQSFLIFSWKTVRKQVAIVGKLQVCHFLQQIITSRLKFYTTRFWIGPHNFEFLEKKSLSFWPKAKTLSYFGLEFFKSAQKTSLIYLVPLSALFIKGMFTLRV